MFHLFYDALYSFEKRLHPTETKTKASMSHFVSRELYFKQFKLSVKE